MALPIYKERYVPASTIIYDGWCRGFQSTQTQQELLGKGYLMSTHAVIMEWVRLEQEYHQQQEQDYLDHQYEQSTWR